MRKTRLEELTIKHNFMFGAVMIDSENCKGFLERKVCVYTFQTQCRESEETELKIWKKYFISKHMVKMNRKIERISEFLEVCKGGFTGK